MILTLRENDPHLEVTGRQSDDGGLVQLRGDGRRQWQHFSQFVKLAVLLFPSSPCGRFGFLLHLGAVSTRVPLSSPLRGTPLVHSDNRAQSPARPLLVMADGDVKI